MLKKTIEYTNFNEEKVTETFYFNFTEEELLSYEAEYNGGIANVLTRMVNTSDKNSLIKEFKKLILATYGEKSDDGKHFIKTPEIAERFSHHAAFSQLYMELVTDDDAGSAFILGVMPKNLAERVGEEDLKQRTAEAIGVRPPTTAELAAQQASQSDAPG